MKHLTFLFLFLLLLAGKPVCASDIGSEDFIQIGRAFFTNLSAHEYGHAIVGSSVGAEGISVSFFSVENKNLFLGYTSTKKIDPKAYPSFALGGEMGAGMSFEIALQSYRRQPTTYNEALLIFSGTDFLWYTVYSFYINKNNPESDPNILHRETGLSKDVIFGVALTQAVLNGYRVRSGSDKIIPYLYCNKDSIGFNLKIPF